MIDDPDTEVDTQDLVFSVQGRAWPYHEKALILLHKPAGYECSRNPRHHPSVLSLLPAPLRLRDVQPVGRLDEDTTGVLLLTDDGALIHRLTSPKWHVAKVYEVGTEHEVTLRRPSGCAPASCSTTTRDLCAPRRAKSPARGRCA